MNGAGKRPGWGMLFRGLLPFAALLAALLSLPEDLGSPARWALAITAGTLAAWILEPVPLAATSIPIVFLLAATGTWTSATGHQPRAARPS